MALPRGSLSLRTAFGMNFSMRANAAWLDADSLVYVVGGFLVRLNIKTRAQTFSVLDDEDGAPASDGGPTAMAISPSKRYLAIAMTSKTGSTISIFSTRTLARRKTLKITLGEGAPGMSGGIISGLAFSSDDAWVAALGVAPSWSLGVFSIDRGRLCALVECAEDAPLAGAMPLSDGDKGDGLGGALLPFEVLGVAFSPTAPERLVAWGSAGYARFFTVVENAVSLPIAPAAAAAAADIAPVTPVIDESATPNAVGGVAEAAAKRRKNKSADEAAAIAAAVEAVSLTHALVPLPSSPIFLAYISALHALHEVQATKRNVSSQAGRRMRRGIRVASMNNPAASDSQAASMESSVYDAQTAADSVASLVDDNSEANEGVDEIVATFVDDDANLSDEHVRTPEPIEAPTLTPQETAIVTAAVEAARASTTPALAWLSFTAGAWLSPSGPVNVVPTDNASTNWTPEASADVIALATAAGDILAFKQGVLLASLPTAPRDGNAILTLAPFSRGFLAGSAGGNLRVFELLDPEIYAAEQEDLKSGVGIGGSAQNLKIGLKAHAGSVRRMSARSRVLKSRSNSAARMSSAASLKSTVTATSERHDEAGLGIIEDPFTLGPLGLGAFFVSTRTLQVEQIISAASPEPSVTFIAIRPDEKSALVIVAGSQCMLLDLANLNVTEGNRALSELTSLSSHSAPPNSYCGPGSALNTCAIIAMDVAARKPLIVTAGVDRVIRVWNWVERSCDLARAFDEMPVTVAMAPSGFHVIVAVNNFFSLFSVLANGLRKLATYQVRGVTRAKFSRGGAFFAVAAGSHVNIYSTLTGCNLFSLRGHSAAVTSLVWAYNDATLVSTGLDGAIFEWDVREGKRGREYLHRGLRIFGASYSKDNRSAVLVGDITTQAGTGPGSTAPDSAPALSSSTPHTTHSHVAPSVTLAVLREVDLDTGVVMKDWIFDAGVTHAGVAITTQLTPPMMFSCEGKLPGVQILTSGSAAIVDPLAAPLLPPRGPAGLAGVPSAIVANAAAKAWASASEPGGGAVWSYDMPLASAPYPGAGAAASAAIAAAQGRGVGWTPESGGALPIPFDPPAAARFSCAGTSAHSLLLSSDEMYLFAAGMNGTIFVYDVRDSEGQVPTTDAPSKIPWSDEIQLTRADLLERQNSLKFLREQLGEVQANAEYKSITRENGEFLFYI